MAKREQTKYPGVFFREADRIGGKGKEKVFYVVYKKDGKVIEAKAGRQHSDDMTPSKANQYRLDLIEGRALPPQEKRRLDKEARQLEDSKWTINRLWDLYRETFPTNKVISHESKKFDNYIRDSLGNKEPHELLALDVDRLRLKLQKAGKLTTAARVLELLRRTLNFGVKRGLTQALQFKIEIPKLNNMRTESLSEAELTALLLALDADDDQVAADVMRIALYTGMRRSEILKLAWHDLDFERSFIILRNPKGGRDQVIPMSTDVQRIFKQIEPLEGNPYVFPGRKPGSHLTECRTSFARIKQAAGLPEDFRVLHGLRHSFASMLAENGIDLYTIQKLLTHKSPTMTQRYAHLRDEALRKASNVAGSVINRHMPQLTEENARVIFRLDQVSGQP